MNALVVLFHSTNTQVNALTFVNSAMLSLLCCAGHVRLTLCTLVVQHSCYCCFCLVRKAFVVVIVKLVLPVDVIVITVAVFLSVPNQAVVFVPEADTAIVFLFKTLFFDFVRF